MPVKLPCGRIWVWAPGIEIFFLVIYEQDLDVNIELSTWEDAGTFKAK